MFNKALILKFSIVDESGASIYSVTEEAKKEFKELDPNLISSGKVVRSCFLIS